MEILTENKNFMTIDQFIEVFVDVFDDVDPSEIKSDTFFQELDEWSSLSVLGVIAMVKEKYDRNITAKEIRSCETVGDLYNYLENAE